MSRIPSKIRAAALDAAGRACQSCGAGEPLEIVHVIPLRDGGDDTTENLAVLCANCHSRLDRLEHTEVEFVFFLAELLRAHSDYTDVQIEPRILAPNAALRPDLMARRGGRTLLVEVKRVSFMRKADAQALIAQLEVYRAVARPSAVAVAFPGRMSTDTRAILEAAGIEVWDLDYIAGTFASQLKASRNTGFALLFALARPLTSKTSSPAMMLVARLHACPPGPSDWNEYQKLVRDALELMFCPALARPIWESSDASGINRRDIILPNEASTGFWSFMRERYGADYIVVDPKNYVARVKKAQVLQIANYLKAHGTGTFAMIFTRSGEERNALLTRREQWAVYGKLILLLTDDDLEAMLLAFDAGGAPHEVLTTLIRDFRLSL